MNNLPNEEDLAWMRDSGNDLYHQCERAICELRATNGSQEEYLRIKDEQISGLRAAVESRGHGIARAEKAIGRRNGQNAAMGQEIERMKGRIRELGAEVDNANSRTMGLEMELEQCTAPLRAALTGLADRLEFIENNEAYKTVWLSFANHGGQYTGPTYIAELENARSALSSITGGS